LKVRIPLMIQDPMTSKRLRIKATEGFYPDNEEFFLDGPVTKRVAVIDFSPVTGKPLTSAHFRPPPPRRVCGWYSARARTKNVSKDDLYEAKGKKLYSPAFIQVSAFATVLKTIYLFEGARQEKGHFMQRPFSGERAKDTLTHTLGRPLTWAFDSLQLLVVPRAGELANAYYHRDSHSLQFFYYPSPKDRSKNVYTCLSRDIVAHETGHAIVDGIAPDLLDACTPQSLGIHEAIADLTACSWLLTAGPSADPS